MLIQEEKHLIIISKQSGNIVVDDEKKKPLNLPSLKDEVGEYTPSVLGATIKKITN